ncbi:PQQ-binding-like beta-propeller repeat protein [Streptomyces sp. NPDC004327]|uniref:outer membrane protein assembly factor BamB family protein n=1 Tax=unclassified Streptomyces TaxID=2593676 RepID=UPI0036BD6411
MTQPPSNQPPPQGFGAPDPDPRQDPPQDPRLGQNVPPQVPAAPPVPPQAPAAPPMPPQAPAAPPMPPTVPQAPPVQPPAQPGPYGYPQQPQSGPYGYPQQPQPGPYGQQPGPYGQQPNPYGGYPTAPMPGAPAPGSGGGNNPFKGKPGVIVAAAAAALLVIGGGTWFALSGGGDDNPVAKPSNSSSTVPKPTDSVDKGDGKGDGGEDDNDLNSGRKPGEAKVDWLLKNNVDLPRNGADVFGPWIVGDTVVKAMYKGIDGYSLADGSAKWHLDVPFKLCAAAQEPAANGAMVFAYQENAKDGAKCTELQQVDATSGKAGWKQSVPKGAGFFGFSDNTLAISGSTVTAAGSSSAYGYSLADGKQLFGFPAGASNGKCKPIAFAGGSKLIGAVKCPSGDASKEQQAVSEFDPVTGKAKWQFSLKPNWEVDKVYSVDPLVVSATQRDEKKWSVFALNANGSLRSQIQGSGNDKYAPHCGGTFVIFGQNLQGCTGVAADANTFYMATDTSYGTSNEVVAFDLNTGKQKWRSKAPAEQQMTPLRMEGSDVLLYVEPKFDKGGAVATLAPTGGAPKVVLQHQVATAEIESSFYSARYAYSNGTFVIAAGRVSAANDQEEKETKTMMAYGK